MRGIVTRGQAQTGVSGFVRWMRGGGAAVAVRGSHGNDALATLLKAERPAALTA